MGADGVHRPPKLREYSTDNNRQYVSFEKFPALRHVGGLPVRASMRKRNLSASCANGDGRLSMKMPWRRGKDTTGRDLACHSVLADAGARTCPEANKRRPDGSASHAPAQNKGDGGDAPPSPAIVLARR